MIGSDAASLTSQSEREREREGEGDATYIIPYMKKTDLYCVKVLET